MTEQPKAAKEILDFQGMKTNVSKRDVDANAAVDQVNCCSIKQGELQVRRGYTVVTFE